MTHEMKKKYEKDGFVLIERFLADAEVESIAEVVTRFHESWIADNSRFYQEQAINSAYLTGSKHLEERDRIKLFKLVSTAKLLDIVQALPIDEPAFLNTQLFFDPINPDQKNYWHRDSQYQSSIEQQKQALDGPEASHFRVALKDEPGIELVPGSHKNWDSEEEFNVRLEKSGKKNHQDLTTGQAISLSKGDLLIFSANMIHRGLYGKNRMALDILFCEAKPEFFKFADVDCLPDEFIIKELENPIAMRNAVKMMSNEGELSV